MALHQGGHSWPSVSESTWKRPDLSTSQISINLTLPIRTGGGKGAARRIRSTTYGPTCFAPAGARLMRTFSTAPCASTSVSVTATAYSRGGSLP